MKTRTPVLLLTALLLLSAALLAATGGKPFGTDRPPGVAAEHWHSLSPDLGLYVGPQSTQPKVLGPRHSVNGTLMARINGRWVAIQLSADNGPYLVEEP